MTWNTETNNVSLYQTLERHPDFEETWLGRVASLHEGWDPTSSVPQPPKEVWTPVCVTSGTINHYRLFVVAA